MTVADRSLCFVDSLAVDPVVLLDLDEAPYKVVEWNPGLPSRERSWASSPLVDGAVESSSAYSNRELTIELLILEPDDDGTAFAWQDLARVLSAPRWLRYTPRDSSSPVFFRTFPCSPEEIQQWAMADGAQVVVTIPADPFGYGLPESGAATVVNDPTQPNGMRFVLDDVKGDVPAPLRMEMAFSWLWGSSSSRYAIGVSSTTHPWLNHGSAMGPSGSGWTASTQSDPSAIGGSYRRMTGASGAASAPFEVAFTDVMPGEYRLIARARSSSAASFTAVSHRLDSVGVSAPLRSVWSWVDLGVVRLPPRSALGSTWSPAVAADHAFFIHATAANPAGATIDVDHVVAIPAPGADDSLGHLGIFGVAGNFDPMEIAGVTIDPMADAAFSVYGGATMRTWSAVGGFPTVVPGQSNQVTTWAAYDTDGDDSKTRTISIDWSYHPRYLYLRGD